MSSISGASETFPNGPENGRDETSAARRTMADITRLFMNGAPARPGQTPRRVSPQARAQQEARAGGAAVASAAARAPLAGSAAVARPMIAPARPRVHPTIQLAIVEPLGAQGLEALLEAAKRLAAGQQCSVGVIRSEGAALTIFRVDAYGSQRFVGTTFAHPESPLDVQIARTLFGLRASIDTWLVGLPSLNDPMAERLCAAASDWLLFSGLENDSLVACYRSLKRIRGMVGSVEDRHIRLFVYTSDAREARRVHGRLENVAQGFLDQPLELLSLDQRSTAEMETVARFSVAPAAMMQNAWMSVVDFIHEVAHPDEETESPEEEPHADFSAEEELLLENVLDPEERAALAGDDLIAAPPAPDVPSTPTAGVEPEGSSAPRGRADWASPGAETAPQQDKTISLPRSAEIVTTPPSPSALIAVETPAGISDRRKFWAVIQDGLAALHAGHTVLVAQPPQESAAALTVNPEGRIHLWTLADRADLPGWSGLQQWAQLHRPLLALTRAEGLINAALPVVAHVILPADAPRQAVPPASDSVRWYRLERIIWNGRSGVVVVPQA